MQGIDDINELPEGIFTVNFKNRPISTEIPQHNGKIYNK